MKTLNTKLIVIWLLGVGTLSFWLYDIAFSADTVTVDSKHWQCTASQPKGINAECMRLEKKL